MQGKLLNNCCELVLNAQALLRMPRLDLSSPARLGHKIQFSSTGSPLGPEQLCINDGSFWLCDMEKEGEGGKIQGAFPCDAVAQLCNFSKSPDNYFMVWPPSTGLGVHTAQDKILSTTPKKPALRRNWLKNPCAETAEDVP